MPAIGTAVGLPWHDAVLGGPGTGGGILMETGGYILLEDNGVILLEQ